MTIPFKWQADTLLRTVPDDSFGSWITNAPGGVAIVAGSPGSFPLTFFFHNGELQSGSGTLYGSNIQKLGQAHVDSNRDRQTAFVWTERGTNGSDVYVGQSLGPSRTLVGGGAGDQADPSVAVGADGGFVVAYNDLSVSGGLLVVKVFDANGVLLRSLSTADLTPGVSTAGPQTFRDVSVGADDSGTYWVAWGDGSPQEIRLARIFNNGAGINNESQISVAGEVSTQPNVTVLDSGIPFVTWVAGTGQSTSIKASFVGSTPIVILPDVTPDAGQQVSSAELSDGRIVVTAVGRDGDILARVINADGSPDGDVFVVNADNAAFCVRPVVAELDDGRFVITWEENQVGDENLMYAIFDPREAAAEMSGTDQNDDFFGTAFGDLYLMNDGDDRVHGADGDDRLSGELGSDRLFGDAGADVLSGGRGEDFLHGGLGADRLDGGADRDTVTYEDATAAISLTVGIGGLTGEAAGDTYVSIEAFVGSSFADVMTGSSLGDALTGGFGSDQLSGGAGADVLDGGFGNDVVEGGAGADDMTGGPTSFDTDTLSYAGSNAGVTVNLGTGSASGGHAQGDVFGEFANLTGSAFGDSLTGGFESNTLSGGGGADVLFGLNDDDILDGGAGADVLTGGLQNDTYVVDDIGDVVVEAANEGTDTVLSSVTFNASVGSAAGLENITLTGTSAINGLGNGLANILIGNVANNGLNGGAGADRMVGGKGNDTYTVDDAGDLIVENAGEGIDLVRSSVTFNANVSSALGIENITLTGSASINALGNALANVLTGNAGNNGLNGGAGADRLIGGQGDDTYTIDDAGDVMVELTGQGADTVRSMLSQTLGDAFENLSLIGSGSTNGIGNTVANIILGNGANNILAGKGGGDNLTGGAGSDTFDYNAVSESAFSTFDRITDLTDDDIIDLSGIDANTSVAGNQTFTLVDAFSAQAGQIVLIYNPTKDFTVLSADVDGDGVADMRIVLNGDHESFTNLRL